MAEVVEHFEIFECSVCYQNLLHLKARTLKCNHTFCEGCLKNLQVKLRITCPKCREVTEVDCIETLPINCDLGKMKEVLQTRNQFCTICLQEGRKNSGVARCVECFRILCEVCRANHNRIANLQSHTLLPVQQIEAEIRLRCRDHAQDVSYVCLKCMIGLCTDCLLGIKHRDHIDETEEYPSGITKVKEKISSMMAHITATCQGGLLDRTLSCVNKNKEKVEQVSKEINRALFECVNHIENLRHNLLMDLQARCVLPLEVLEQSILQASKDVSNIRETLSQWLAKCDEEIVNELPDVNSRLAYMNNAMTTLCKSKLPVPKYSSGLIGRETMTTGTLKVAYEDCEDFTNTPNTDISPHVNARQLLCLKNGTVSIRNPAELWALEDSLLYTDNRVDHVQRISQSGQIVARYYPQNEQGGSLNGVQVYGPDLFIVQSGGITKVPLAPVGYGSIQVYNPHTPDITSMAVVSPSQFVLVDTYVDKMVRYDALENSSTVEPCSLSDPQHIIARHTSEGVQLCVTDSAANKILIFDENLREVAVIGSPDALFNNPTSTVFLKNGNILVADTNNHRVCEFSLSGSFVRDVLTAVDGIEYPWSMAVKDDFLWLTQYDVDVSERCIKLFQLNLPVENQYDIAHF